MSRHESEIDKVIVREGRVFTNRAADRGGPTKFGITWRTWAEAKKQGLVPRVLEIQDATEDHARLIYRVMYWEHYGCSALSEPFDAILFDLVVNHSPRAAIRILQRGLGVTDDGIVGPATTRAAGRAVGVPWRLKRVLAERIVYYKDLCIQDPVQNANFAGWVVRTLDLHQDVLGVK